MKKEIGVLAIAGATLFVGGCTGTESSQQPFTPTPNNNGDVSVTNEGPLGGPGGNYELYKSVDNKTGQACYIVTHNNDTVGGTAISCPIIPTSSSK